ncbi:gustatory receptor for bitter taste 66a [Glossina fuscipes]|uniref:Gustatory receptor n=1 Tax=Glossina fuscipes TaxID=7396 RepID=A0A8U0W917_9MUSC|nr:gustatory receptor for bitter taste 66a [Glossina fuscipes]
MSQQHQQSCSCVLLHFTLIYYLCKFLGIYPQSVSAYRNKHALEASKSGSILVIIVMIWITVCYNIFILSQSDGNDQREADRNALNFVISIFLTQIKIILMATDQLSSICNQGRLGEFYDRLYSIDSRLIKAGCVLNNGSLAWHCYVMVAMTFLLEIIITLLTYAYLHNYTQWVLVVMWIFSCLPTLYDSLDKIWFTTTLHALRQRLSALNRTLTNLKEDESDELSLLKMDYVNGLEYLKRVLNAGRVVKFKNRMRSFDLNKVEERLINVCQLHDEICELIQTFHKMWTYPILALMAYGFLIFTAQLYFTYCVAQNQPIPILFRSAESLLMSILFLSYTGVKCIYLIFSSWKTALEAKYTGIALHKYAINLNDKAVYEIVNHSSLKLLNHAFDFANCGFLSLSMRTLCGLSGVITSYTIILVQFNFVAQQSKEADLKKME